jgi:hypothetical protein
VDSAKYIGMYVHKEAISIAVLNSSGKLAMECTMWAGRREKLRPQAECFFLTPSIELIGS